MDIEEELEARFDSGVTVERTAPEARGRDGTVEFTVYCEPGSEEEVRKRLEGFEEEVAFETIR